MPRVTGPVHAHAVGVQATASRSQRHVRRSGRSLRGAQALLRRSEIPVGRTGLQLLDAVGRRTLVPQHLHLLGQALLCVPLAGIVRHSTLRRIPAVVVALGPLVGGVAVALRVLRLVPQEADDHPPPHDPEKIPVRALALREVIRVRSLLLSLLGLLVGHCRPALAPGPHVLVLATVQRLAQARSEIRIPPLVLLPHPRRHPGHKHRIHEHLQESHSPAELPTLAVHRVGVELLHQVLHAEKPARVAREARSPPLDRPQRVAQLQPRRFQQRTLRQTPSPLLGRHHAPMRHHHGPSVVAVPVTQDRSAIRGVARRHHQHAPAVIAHKLPADLPELPPELVQRSVLHLVRTDRVTLALLLQHQRLPLVELVQFAVPSHGRVVLRLADHLSRTQHASTRGVQRHAFRQGKD